MIAVFDTGVIVSAIFWHTSTARRCLVALARRRFRLALTNEILNEYVLTCTAFRVRRPQQNPSGPLAWITSRALHVTPVPLGKQRSRDAKDDPFLACALAARANYLVSSDRDLLVLGKPFGIAIVTPFQFLRSLDP
jgi:putative PIN family toxin of toxin-antitoxin system